MPFENKSWVPVSESSHFPLENLPYCVFFYRNVAQDQIGVAIGDMVLSLYEVVESGILSTLLPDYIRKALCFPTLNYLMSLHPTDWRAVRDVITQLLSKSDGHLFRDNAALVQRALIPQKDVVMRLPATIGDYTDFYSSKSHATNVGIMFRGPENALNPNWLHMPIGYHGRASSVVVSGTDIIRPQGQIRPEDDKAPIFGPCRNLDFELEIAFFVGGSNAHGHPIPMKDAQRHIFGLVLMNDWSARDIQKWEYVPLGPFNGKNFGTSISPWIVTMDALAPFTTAAERQVPDPLTYLQDPDHCAYDIALTVDLKPEKGESMTICRSNAKHLYWSFKQQLVHHTSTGCNVRPGDLMASGTISGPEPGSFGSMLEICWKGTKPLKMPDGSERRFLADGDTVIMTGVCESERVPYKIGFGSVCGKILPAAM